MHGMSEVGPLIIIALHNQAHIVDGNIDDIVHDVVCNASGHQPSIHRFDGPIDLIDMPSSSDGNLVGLVILPYELPGMNGIQTVVEAREIVLFMRSILFAPSIDHAAEAAQRSIDGYLVEPASSSDFARVLERIVRRITAFHASSAIINTRDGAKRIAFDQVLYCETSGHNQIVHFLDGSTMTTRCSSQSMFDSFAGDKRFFKAGSSYIVNLHEVVQAQSSKGIVTLSDGSELNVPARLRKSLETALLTIE